MARGRNGIDRRIDGVNNRISDLERKSDNKFIDLKSKINDINDAVNKIIREGDVGHGKFKDTIKRIVRTEIEKHDKEIGKKGEESGGVLSKLGSLFGFDSSKSGRYVGYTMSGSSDISDLISEILDETKTINRTVNEINTTLRGGSLSILNFDKLTDTQTAISEGIGNLIDAVNNLIQSIKENNETLLAKFNQFGEILNKSGISDKEEVQSLTTEGAKADKSAKDVKGAEAIGKGLKEGDAGLKEFINGITAFLSPLGLISKAFENFYKQSKELTEIKMSSEKAQFDYDTGILKARAGIAKAQISYEKSVSMATIQRAKSNLGEAVKIQSNAFVQAVNTETGTFIEGLNKTAYNAARAAIKIGADYGKLRSNMEMRSFVERRTKMAAKAGLGAAQAEGYASMVGTQFAFEQNQLENAYRLESAVLGSPIISKLNSDKINDIRNNLKSSPSRRTSSSAGPGAIYGNMGNVISDTKTTTGQVLAHYVAGSATQAELDQRYAGYRLELQTAGQSKMWDANVKAIGARIHAEAMQAQAEIQNSAKQALTEAKNARIEAAQQIQERLLSMAETVEQILDEIEKHTFDLGKNLGILTSKGLVDFQKSFQKNMIDIAKDFGKPIEEMAELNKKYIDQTGRMLFFSHGDMRKVAALGSLGVDDNDIASYISEMQVFNYGVSASIDMINKEMLNANKIGINARKYIKDATKFLSQAVKYNFKNGVKGAMDMVRWAQNLNINMSTVTKTIESFSGGIEDIIEKSAKLQVLGGNIAMYSDPLGMMYDRWNDPQALMGRVENMLKGFGTMKNNGDVYYNGNEERFLQQMSKIINMDVGEMKKISRYHLKKGDVSKYIRDNNLTQDQLMNIISKAVKNENGDWVVKDKNQQDMLVSDITTGNISKMQADTPIENIEDYAKQIVEQAKQIAGIQLWERYDLSLTVVDERISNYKDRIAKAEADYEAKKEELKSQIIQGMEFATSATKSFLNIAEKARENLSKELNQIMAAASNVGGTIAEVGKVISASRKDLMNQLNAQISAGLAALGQASNINADVGGDINEMAARYGTETKQAVAERAVGEFKRITNGARTWESLKQNQINQLKKFINESKYGYVYKRMLEPTGAKGLGNWGFGEMVKAFDVIERLLGNRDAFMQYSQTQTSPTSGVLMPESSSLGRKELYTNDFISLSNNKPTYVDANSSKSINDGFVDLGIDSSLTNGENGPFDKLFNGIFKNITSIYDILKVSLVEVNDDIASVIYDVSRQTIEDTSNMEEMMYAALNNDGDVKHVSKNIKCNVSGNLSLSGNYQKVDIINILQNNPDMMKKLGELFVDVMSRTSNGGKGYVSNNNNRNVWKPLWG